MGLIEIDVVGVDAAQAVVDLREDRLARQPRAVRTEAHRVADLGRDDDLVAVGEVRKGAPDDLFARTLRVHVGGIEEVDAGFEGVLDQRPAVVLAERPHGVAAVGFDVGHAAEGDR